MFLLVQFSEDILEWHGKFCIFPSVKPSVDSQFLQSLDVTRRVGWWHEWMPVLHSAGPFCTHGPGIRKKNRNVESRSSELRNMGIFWVGLSLGKVPLIARHGSTSTSSLVGNKWNVHWHGLKRTNFVNLEANWHFGWISSTNMYHHVGRSSLPCYALIKLLLVVSVCNQHSAPLQPSTILARPCQAAPFHDFLSTKALAFVNSSAVWNRSYGVSNSRRIDSSTMSMSMSMSMSMNKYEWVWVWMSMSMNEYDSWACPRTSKKSINWLKLTVYDFNVSHWWIGSWVFLSILRIT